MKAARRLLTAAEAAVYVDCPSVKAFHSLLYKRRKQGRPVKCYHRGRALRFKTEDLDRVFDVEEPRPMFRQRQAGLRSVEAAQASGGAADRSAITRIGGRS